MPAAFPPPLPGAVAALQNSLTHRLPAVRRSPTMAPDQGKRSAALRHSPAHRLPALQQSSPTEEQAADRAEVLSLLAVPTAGPPVRSPMGTAASILAA